MIKNYLKISLRHFQKNKAHSVLNLLGLVIAFSCAILIYMYIRFEFSYDTYHKNSDTIYRVISQKPGDLWRGTDMWNATPAILKPTLIENFAEIEKASTLFHDPCEIVLNQNHFSEPKFFIVEPEFLQIFSFPLLKGNIKTALKEPMSLLLTESKAKQYFANENPIGKTIIANDLEYKITGILRDVPANSHFSFDFLASFKDINDNINLQGGPSNWYNNNFSTYFQVRDGTNTYDLEEKITKVIQTLHTERTPTIWHLQKLTDIHLYSKVNREFEANSSILYIYIFSAIAILLIIIACFNYMNMSTVQTLIFAKETGVRKVSGAKNKHISFQFIFDATILTLVAFIISVIIVLFLIPLYGHFVERELTIEDLMIPKSIFLFLSIILSVGFISGCYPAILLTRQKPVRILKNNKISGSKTMNGIRNILVISQFVISIILIIGALVLYKQLYFIQNKELGYQKENIISIPEGKSNLAKKYNVFKQKVMQHPNVKDVTFSQTGLDINDCGGSAFWEGKPENYAPQFYHIRGDYNFIEFYGIKLTKGRLFSKNLPTDKGGAFILNQAAVEAIGWKDPIGKTFQFYGPKGKVIGVVEDFHFQSLHLNIEPLVISVVEDPYFKQHIFVKISSGDLHQTIQFIEAEYKKIAPGYQFSFAFLDDQLENLYRADLQQGQIFSVFTCIAFFIAGLGLFGMALFLIKQRTKEIGVRRVNGASTISILAMLNSDFVRWIIISIIIACPIAWYTMKKWLENFAYKTELSWWIFALAGGTALLIALLTVSWQSWCAANRNPVEALRYE